MCILAEWSIKPKGSDSWSSPTPAQAQGQSLLLHANRLLFPFDAIIIGGSAEIGFFTSRDLDKINQEIMTESITILLALLKPPSVLV